MRRLVILFLLLAGVHLILPLGEVGGSSQWLLTLGFLILAAYSAGEIASGLRLPKIVGYLIGGMAFGPSGLHTVTAEASSALAPVSDLAIALIAFLAGAELRWDEVRDRGKTIAKILTAELGLTLVLLTGFLALLGSRVPFLAGLDPIPLLAVSLLFASIAVIHSPAVTMALLTETRAAGPVARTTLGVVLVADVVVVILFSGALALARVLAPGPGGGAVVSMGAVVWELTGAVLVGAMLGGAATLYLRFIKRELFLFAGLLAFAGAALAKLLHVEPLLMLITAGFVTENLSTPADGMALRHAMARSADPVFVVFFALAGVAIQVRTIAQSLALVVPLVIVRAAGIWGGTKLGARWAGVPEQGGLISMGLVAQAGVAIGLARVVTQAFPVRGLAIQTIFLALLGLNQLIGPILFRRALVRSGEIGRPPRARVPGPSAQPANPMVPVPPSHVK